VNNLLNGGRPAHRAIDFQKKRIARSAWEDIMSDAGADSFPVIIAGGGLVGLSTAMFLATHGVPSLVVERLRGGSPVPRAAHFHLRTLELFRLAGIEEDVKQQSEREFLPEGAIVAMDSLAGKKLADIIGSLNAGVEEVSPSRRLFITQPGLEPILKARARKAGAQVLEGHEITAIAQDGDGVTVTLRDVETGAEQTRRCQYLVGADGAHSKVRDILGIPFDGRGVFSNSITIYFTADVSPQMGGKPLSVIYINNPKFGGFFRLDKDCQAGFLVVNTVGDPKTNPDAAHAAAADTSNAKLIEWVRIGVGVPDLDVRIDGVARWRATSDVARKFQDDRVFLAGDAAHLMPPNGGFGGNTGIHDAHNLACKLAYVVKGFADPKLLDSYEPERRAVSKFTVEQAYTRYVTRTATYLGATDYEPVAPDFNVEIGYIYNSPAIVAEPGEQKIHDDPRNSQGRPGSRAPHVWLERDGKKISSLDLFGAGFVLVAGAQGGRWRDVCQQMAGLFPGLPLACHVIGDDIKDNDDQFARSYGLSPDGATLVRPDGFVGWRAVEMPADPQSALAQALRRLLALSST
jgi:2-polyprenyl-6-methoxyphenol hydroxylase-like FAD-dependent oxidoreductase